MKKILIVNKNLNPGGAEHQLINIANYLIDKGHEVDFLLFERKGDLLRKTHANIKCFPQSVTSTFNRSKYLRHYLKNSKYDISLTFLPECNLINCIASFPTHSWRVVTGLRSANPSFKTDFKLKLYYYIHWLSDLVISNSETNANDVRSVVPFLPKQKIKVIYNILRPNAFKPGYVPFQNNRINVAIAANYREVKNLMELLKALTMLTDLERDKIHFEWYGMKIDSTLDQAMIFIAQNGLHHCISLNPSTANVSQVYECADVVGLFSKYEGLPNSICEALIQGKPVITTPVSDLPALLQGTHNIVAEGCDAASIASALKRLINLSRDLILSCGAENKSHFRELFDTNKIQKELTEAIIGE